MNGRLLGLVAGSSAAALVALALATAPEPVVRGAKRPVPADPARFVVVDARVFDGGKLWPRASVQVADGRIERIAEMLEVPKDYERIEGRGRTLLPGLIDAHVHTWGEARREALRFGVTTMLDMFSDHRQLAAARSERAELDRTDRADLWSAGTLATAAGGHGTQFGLAVPTLATPEEAPAWVAARKAEGSDWIKLVREDLHAYTDARRLPTLDDATAAAVIAAAHAQGLRAVAHVSGIEHARASLRDGADGLVHVFQNAPADPALLELARARGAFVIPTLGVLATMSGERGTLADDARLAPFLSAGQRQSLQASFDFAHPGSPLLERARANVRALHAAGVPLLAGTDAPNAGTAHGVSMHGELVELVRAGLSPLEALAAATRVPAQSFGLDDRGRIAAGLRADLLLVEGDPSQDIEATRAIVTIWKNGRAVDREAPRVNAEGKLAAGVVSDFDDGTLAARQGLGWSATTDRIAGGGSDATLTPKEGALRIEGRIADGAAYPWGGAMYSPGSALFAAVDARGLRELSFRLRGDGRPVSAMLFSGPQDGRPAMQFLTTTPEWREVRLPLADFAGFEPGALRALAITAGAPAGEFWFELDAVEIR